MPRKPVVPFEDKVAKAINEQIDSDARAMAAMLGPLPDSSSRSDDEDLQDWMFRAPNVDLAELQTGVAMNQITPQMAQAIQFNLEQGWLDAEEAPKLTPKDAGMLALYPRRLVLMRTGRPDPEMQIRFSDRMESRKRKMLEESAEEMPMEGMMDGSSMGTGPDIGVDEAGALPDVSSLLAEGGIPNANAGSPLGPETLTQDGGSDPRVPMPY